MERRSLYRIGTQFAREHPRHVISYDLSLSIETMTEVQSCLFDANP